MPCTLTGVPVLNLLNLNPNLIKYLNQDMQSIITTTDINEINSEFIEKALVYKIENGTPYLVSLPISIESTSLKKSPK